MTNKDKQKQVPKSLISKAQWWKIKGISNWITWDEEHREDKNIAWNFSMTNPQRISGLDYNNDFYNRSHNLLQDYNNTYCKRRIGSNI